MAELAVAAAALSVQLLLPLLKEIKAKKDVIKEVKSMKSWLESMKAFIKDNDGRERNDVMKVQVEEIRDAAYEIEDVLDEIVLHSSYVFHRHKITKKAYKVAHGLKHGLPLRNISEKIETIKGKIKEVKEQKETFQDASSSSRPASSSGVRIGHLVSPLLLDNEMVGYETQKKEFIRELMNGDKELVKLAIVGPFGSGKTTFAKNVFWKQTIWSKFDCHAWVHVSRQFNADEIFINLLKQFCASKKESYPVDDGLNSQEKLRKYLEGKKYIVVLDDIWKEGEWDIIKNALPSGNRGSRIVVTTRDMDIASICASANDSIYKLNGLESLEAWRLFCKKAFPESSGECPPELKDCSIRIVKRCEGLPSAIIAVGRALSLKSKLPSNFETFHNNLGNGSSTLQSVISNTLLPSYMDLPSNLKSCFLYFGMFPEDYSIDRGRLIRLWVAEQFVEGTDCETAEEVGENYLNELIHRNLVHVSRWDFDDRPRNCRVLNLVLNFIIQKCKDENFASIFPREITSARRLSLCNDHLKFPGDTGGGSSKKLRFLSLYNDHLKFPGDTAGVRSLLLFKCVNDNTCNIVNNFRGFKLLKTLDLQGAPLKEFPQQITHLILLRYISLSETAIKMIPSSIKKFVHLETLNLKQTNVEELPKEISRLHNLRHLFAYNKKVKHSEAFDTVQGVTLCQGIGDLTKLQKLSLVKVDQKGEIIKDLKALSQLRKLGLMGLMREHCKDLAASIENMEKLVTLSLCSATKEECLELETMKNPPKTLQRLYLKGKLKKLPLWIDSSLHNLCRIGLKWSKLQESPLKALQQLPNLLELQLVDCYVKEELIFEVSSFKKLKILHIEKFSRLHTIVIQQGAMPDLIKMSLRRCPKLKILPLGIDDLHNVKELILNKMSKKLITRVTGEDKGLVEHIPYIEY